MGETISTKQSEIDLTVSIVDIATSQIIFSDNMSSHKPEEVYLSFLN